jgi:hypothetical protein
MSILWMGGEDIDFPNGTVAPSANTQSGAFRTAYARCATQVDSGGVCVSTPLQGGGATSAWLSAQVAWNNNGQSGPWFGLVNTASANGSGIWVGSYGSGSPGGQIALYLVTSTGNTFLTGSGVQNWPSNSNSLQKIDLNIINFGSGSQIFVYANGYLVISYSGSTAISGVSDLDAVGVIGYSGNNNYTGISEVIVANETTLSFQGLVTLAPNGNGATQNWTNPAYTNFDPVSINDTDSTYVNTTGQDEQATLSAIPSGTFQLRVVKLAARALATSGASSTNLELGFNNTNTSVVAVNPQHALTSSFETYEDYFTTDPTSSGGTGAWGSSLAGYELDLRSA